MLLELYSQYSVTKDIELKGRTYKRNLGVLSTFIPISRSRRYARIEELTMQETDKI